MSAVIDIARAARLASVNLQAVNNEQKNEALLRIKQVLSERREEIFKANEQDKKVILKKKYDNMKRNSHYF